MEPLKDPLGDRVIKEVSPPPHKMLSTEILFPQGTSTPDWQVLRDHLQREGRVSKEHIKMIVSTTIQILSKEPNCLALHDPVTVVGDIHGQFFDFLKLLEVGGSPETTKYLFLGDYVDRGSFSVEVLLLLYAIKINYKDHVFLLRGNHECRQMTSFFNFRQECLYKYDEEIYDLVMDSFDTMSLACIVNDKFIAVHGGISPELKTLKDLNNINRFMEPPRQGIFCDLIWSDPVDNESGVCENTYKHNDVRGCSYFYGADAVNKFLEKNSLLSVLRAHEAQLDGYKMHKWNGEGDFPLVITIFSAPNYCDVYNNKGAIIKFENNTLNIQQFNYSAHPYILPNFMDIFTWSIPFVCEKVGEMLLNIIKPEEVGEESDDDESEVSSQSSASNSVASSVGGVAAAAAGDKEPPRKYEVLRKKVQSVSKIMVMFKTLRQENESIIQLKGLAPDNKIPRGVLLEGRTAIKDAIEAFGKAKLLDKVNERRPDTKN
mmetsp:Transcript_30796/g.35057  ORF Transcript_30796/g.35057 Transcript_30796/m.35057 type:complete len:488 (+) Transcript_30796:135-1598(+)